MAPGTAVGAFGRGVAVGGTELGVGGTVAAGRVAVAGAVGAVVAAATTGTTVAVGCVSTAPSWVGAREAVAVGPAGRGVLVGVGVAVGAAVPQEARIGPRINTAMMMSQGQRAWKVGR
jgi:hypothetical protein